MKTFTLALLLSLTACGVPQSERPQTIAEAKEHCKATAHSPLVNLGIDPARTTIRSRTWITRSGDHRMGEFYGRTMEVWSIDHLEPLYHEYIHRGLRVAGERWSTFGGTFRDEEHSLIYYLLDRDFPGLQAHRIPPQRRRWAKARWERPEYAARLVDIESRARAIGGWCKEVRS